MLYPQTNETRLVMSLDGFWRFKADYEGTGEEHSWFDGLPDAREIAVPGSWNEQYNDLFDFFGKGWYEKDVYIPEWWREKAIWLRIGSACYKAKVWVNGVLLTFHEGGHLPFETDVCKVAKLGQKNRIVIMVDASLDPWALPPASLIENEGRVGFFNTNPPVTYDFYPYGGLHRSVCLYCTSPVRIEDIVITTETEGTTGIVNYTVKLTDNFLGKLTVSTGGIITDHVLYQQNEISGTISIRDAKLWDLGNPNLYELNIKLFDGRGRLSDSYTETYGIRTVKVEGNKFLLNGREVFFKGFGKHEDFPVLGKGLNHNLIVKDFNLMKWIGANSFRTSHYPYAEEMLDFADRHGILVIDETPFVGLNNRMFRKDILEKAKSVIKELIRRDKNHPSVIMWSLANEPYADTREGEEFFREMALTARSLDNTRPITYAAHMEPGDNLGMKYYDVVCLNKYYGWYINPGDLFNMLPEFSKCLDRFYEAFKKPILVSEFGADAIAGMHSEPVQMFSEEYQAETIAEQYRIIKGKEYCIGAHIWAFADFKTAQTITRILLNRKGVFTRDRQPKLAAHKVRKLWTEE